MFLRIDKDLFINIDNISSYKLTQDDVSYKLIVYGLSGNVLHTVIYLKESVSQVNLLIEVNEKLRERLLNPEAIYIPEAIQGDVNE